MDGKFFDECKAVERDGLWFVQSIYWEIPMVDEKSAVRTAEVIRGAYRVGAEDLRQEINNLLSPPMQNDPS